MGLLASFDPAAFAEPPSHFWPGYFWMWNDRLETDKLVAQLEEMRRQDARSVCAHPMPPEFRAKSLGNRLHPEYLSDEFFAIVADVVAACQKLGLHYWLYDEGGWPSGSAAGRVFARNPAAFSRKTLVREVIALRAGEALIVPDNALCSAIATGGDWRIYRRGEQVTAAEATTVHVFIVKQHAGGDPPYVDVLCQDATRVFLELTHDTYARRLKSALGNTVRFAFTDEPAVLGTRLPEQLTWTADMAEQFQARAGYALLPWLPRLFELTNERRDKDVVRVLVDFHDVWSQLFVERFLKPIQQCCARHGLLSGGHFGGEDEPAGSAQHGFGHMLRAFRGLDLPGIDTIWRQLFPGKRAHHFPKYAASIARQKGQPFVFTESFAVYGGGLTPAQMKWVIDEQYVRGVTLTILPNYPYSTREHLMAGLRPQFGPLNPLWKHMDLLHRYIARLSYALCAGRPVCSTAFYFDIRSIWAGGEDGRRAVALHESAAQALLAAQRDFDFVDDDVLTGKEGRVADGRLTVGEMSYDALVVPATKWMSEPALRGLADFLRGGGTVIALDELPASDRSGLQEVLGLSAASDQPVGRGRLLRVAVPELAATLPPVVQLSPTGKDCAEIRALSRAWPGGALYFLVNEADREIRVSAKFDEAGSAVVCDPEDGCGYALPLQNRTAELTFAPWGSRLIVFGVVPFSESKGTFTPTSQRALADGWTLKPLRAYSVGVENYEVRECAEPPRPISLGDWRESLGPHFSGDAEYTISFSCSAEDAQRRARLNLGDVRYACEVILNGQSCGRRIWQPFAVELTGKLKAGANDLRIIVTNTFANALLDPAVRERWLKAPGPGWPSAGQPYDRMTVEFEKDSLPSGLFGPVRLEFQ